MSKISHRLTVRLDDKSYSDIKYYTSKNDTTINDFVLSSIEYYIKYLHGDYDLPTLEIARLNQLCEVIASLSSRVTNLENVTLRGFESLIGLTKGENYLLDNEDL